MHLLAVTIVYNIVADTFAVVRCQYVNGSIVLFILLIVILVVPVTKC